MRTRHLVLAALAALAAVVAFSVANPTAVIGVTNNGLSNSVDRAMDAGSNPVTGGVSCDSRARGYRCAIPTGFKEPMTTLTLDVGDDGCWTGRLPAGYSPIRGEPAEGDEVSGCISLIDQIFPVPWE